MMDDVICEVCGYDAAIGWLLPCKNSYSCGLGRHLFCLDSLKVPIKPPADLASFPPLHCELHTLLSPHGCTSKRRTAGASASSGKRGAQRGAKAASAQATPPQPQPAAIAGTEAGQRPTGEPAEASVPDDQGAVFCPAGSVFARPEAQLDLSVAAEGSVLSGGGGDVGRPDLGRSRSASGQLVQNGSGAPVTGTGSVRQSRPAAPAAAVAAAVTAQRPHQPSLDFTLPDGSSIRSTGGTVAGSGSIALQGSTGSAGQQTAAAPAVAVGADAHGSDSDEEDDRPLKRPKLLAGAKSKKPTPELTSNSCLAAAGQRAEPQHQLHHGAAKAVPAANVRTSSEPGTAVQGEGPRAGKPGSLAEKFKGQLKNVGRCTQLTDRPPTDVPQRGRKKPATGAIGTGTGTAAAAGAHQSVAAASGRATASVAGKPLDPALSAFDDLNSPPQKDALAGTSARHQAVCRPAGTTALATVGSNSAAAAAASAAAGKPGKVPTSGPVAAGASGRPPLPASGANGANGGSHGLGGRVASGGGLPNRMAAGARMMAGSVPAARTPGASFNIKQVFNRGPSSAAAGPSAFPLQASGSYQPSMPSSLNSTPSVDTSPAEVANNDRAANSNGQGRRVDLWHCDVRLDYHAITGLPKVGSQTTLRLIMQSISPHGSMARLCDLLNRPDVLAGGLNWQLMYGYQVPPIIVETRDFYQEDDPCETCLIMHPKRSIGPAFDQFKDLLTDLKATNRFLALEVPSLNLEKVAHDPVLVRLLHALPSNASGACSTGVGGPFRLYFVPHEAPIDGVDSSKGVMKCLLCLTGSRKQIHLMSTWDKTPAAERGIRGILKLSERGPASRRQVTFDNKDKNDHAAGRLLREKDGKREGLALKDTASKADGEPDDASVAADDSSKTLHCAQKVLDSAGKVSDDASRSHGGAGTMSGDTSHMAGKASKTLLPNNMGKLPSGEAGKAPPGDTCKTCKVLPCDTAKASPCDTGKVSPVAAGQVEPSEAGRVLPAAQAEHVPRGASMLPPGEAGKAPPSETCMEPHAEASKAAPGVADKVLPGWAGEATPGDMGEPPSGGAAEAPTAEGLCKEHGDAIKEHDDTGTSPGDAAGNTGSTSRATGDITKAAGSDGQTSSGVLAVGTVAAEPVLGQIPIPASAAVEELDVNMDMDVGVSPPASAVLAHTAVHLCGAAAAGAAGAEAITALIDPSAAVTVVAPRVKAMNMGVTAVADVMVNAPVATAEPMEAQAADEQSKAAVAAAVSPEVGVPSPELPLCSTHIDSAAVAASNDSTFRFAFTWSVEEVGTVAERQARATACTGAELTTAASLGTFADRSMMEPAQQQHLLGHQAVAGGCSSGGGLLQTLGSTTSSPYGCIITEQGCGVAMSHALAGKGCGHGDAEEVLPMAASNNPAAEDPGEQQQLWVVQGWHHHHRQHLGQQNPHVQEAAKVKMDKEDGGQPPLQHWQLLVPALVEDVLMDEDSPDSGSAGAHDTEVSARMGNRNGREECSESSAATAVSSMGAGEEEEEALAGVPSRACETGDVREPVPMDWRSLVQCTPCSDLGCALACVPEHAAQSGEAMDWRSLVMEYGPCSYDLDALPPVLQQQEALQQEPEQNQDIHPPPALEQALLKEAVAAAGAPHSGVGAVGYQPSATSAAADGGAGAASAASRSAVATWNWAKVSMPVLQAPLLTQEGIPYRELQAQLPHLMSDLQRIPTLPLHGCQLRLMASTVEAPELEAALHEAAQELGFSWSSWGPDAAPDNLQNVQVLALSESMVNDISNTKAVIVKSIAVHPIQLYRAESLVVGLQVLARKLRDKADGAEGRLMPTLEAALHLAHSEGGRPAGDCQPLYPARVVVLLDAQGFLKTPLQLLRRLTDQLFAGTATWGEPWQLHMRAADIAAVQRSGQCEHVAVLDNARSDQQQQPRQPVLRELDAAAESTSTEDVVFKDATRLMHLRRPGRLVVAACADDEAAAQYSKKRRYAKNVLAGTVQEVVAFLDLLLERRWGEQQDGMGGQHVGG